MYDIDHNNSITFNFIDMKDYINSKGGDYNPINESIVDQNDPTSESYVKREDAIDFGADLD